MLPEKITRLIGKVGSTTTMEVEKGAIKRYADAVDDFNPIYWDEEYAQNSKYEAMIAPPGFFGWPTQWPKSGPTFNELREKLMTTIAQAGYSRVLDGGIEYEFLSPIRAGDILTALPKIISITERETKTGKLILSVIETTYTNQKSDLVARARWTLIHR